MLQRFIWLINVTHNIASARIVLRQATRYNMLGYRSLNHFSTITQSQNQDQITHKQEVPHNRTAEPDKDLILKNIATTYKGRRDMDGKMHGAGVLTFSSGTTIYATFKNGNIDPLKRIIVTSADGLVEVDNKHENMRNTVVTVRVNDEMHEMPLEDRFCCWGYFIYNKESYDAKNQVVLGELFYGGHRKVGEFANDVFHGKGAVYYSGKKLYEGEFYRGNLKEGGSLDYFSNYKK